MTALCNTLRKQNISMANGVNRFIIFILALSPLLCVSGPIPESLDNKSLAEALLKVDPWPDRSTNYSKASWKQLVSIAGLIQRSDPRTVSEALRKYRSDQVDNSIQEIRNDSKLYLLMRVAFELPERAPNDPTWTSFGRWLTMKTEYNNDGTINRAWPITWNHGDPSLISGCLGLRGIGRYDAAKEFLYFRSKCAFRNLSSLKYGKAQ
jgi:hypothetical protein